MGLFILHETSAGYGLFKASDKKLLEADDLVSRLSTVEKIVREIKYKEFAKFDSAACALEEINGLIEGKITPKLAGLLDELKNEKKVTLAVAENKLGNAIVKLPEVKIKPVSDAATTNLFRAIRQHLETLVPGMDAENFQEMALGLAHSLSRHKLKFSPEKVDVMIVHAISLLDDLDKELNLYAMRVKEWYGWHFPELAKILPDNLSYARIIDTMGLRSNAPKSDLSEILPHEIEEAVKAAADISMGTEITTEDLENIKLLAQQVIHYSDYRKQLAEYLENRMKAIAPNLYELVGYLVGARLIAHAKSLMGLAKNPGSTIQILGAERALFRALKTKHNTPKYGLIYHASLVGQASVANKAKIARQLAAKVALGVRTDALHPWEDDDDEETRAALGIKARAKIENNLRRLEGKPLSKGATINPNSVQITAPPKWDIQEARKYNVEADGLAGDAPLKKPLIQDVTHAIVANGRAESDSDVEMDDASAALTNAPPSPTLAASVSDNTDEEDKAAKKTRKKAEKAMEKAEKKAKRKAEEKKREKRAARCIAQQQKDKRRAERAGAATASETAPISKSSKKEEVILSTTELTAADFERLAKEADMSTKKFIRKYESGKIKVKADGSLHLNIKRKDKHETTSKPKSSKRKHEDQEPAEVEGAQGEKPMKKKKRHNK